MSNVHYFPRYSQKENMITNNTLLLFSRLYNNSNDKFNRFLINLFEEEGLEIDTKINFKQQVKTGKSIPDGMIYQQSFKVVIETKLYSQENIGQIVNHLSSFDDEDTSIFLFIDKKPMSKAYEKKVRRKILEFNEEHDKGIQFISTTFKDICSIFEDTLNEYDFEMIDLIADYKSFCNESNLIDNFETKIRVVLSGITLEKNMKNNIYYAPSTRSYQSSRYLGLYKNKSIRAIGEVMSIVDADVRGGELIHTEEIQGTLDDEMKSRLVRVIKEAREDFSDDISRGCRFFFVNEFIETDYTKDSKGGLMGTRYFDLSTIDGYEKSMSANEIASLLKEKEWK